VETTEKGKKIKYFLTDDEIPIPISIHITDTGHCKRRIVIAVSHIINPAGSEDLEVYSWKISIRSINEIDYSSRSSYGKKVLKIKFRKTSILFGLTIIMATNQHVVNSIPVHISSWTDLHSSGRS
jgi:hypothetical protein